MTVRKVPLCYVRGGQFVLPDGQGGWRTWGGAQELMPRLRALYQPTESLYLFDLDGQFNGVANLPILQVLERGRVFPWVDVGCRRAEDAVDALFAGAEAITLNPHLLPPAELEEFVSMVEGDFHLGYVADAKGLAEVRDANALLRRVQDLGATGVVFYEGDSPGWSGVEGLARGLAREGIPAAWVAKPESTWTQRALAGDVFQNVMVWEPPQ